LRKGVYHLARSHAGTQVVPIAMHGLGRALPKGGSMIVPFNADVVIGEALLPGEDSNAFMQDLQTSLEGLLAQCITKRDARWEDE
jgi:1-acyl-sn-glycerol-3-phosphate acyltransferase